MTDPADHDATILLVDDDADTRASIRRVLEREGHRVLEADGPALATEVAERRGGEVDLVILDVVMPGRSGISTADTLGEHVDPLRILFVSGYIEGELPEREETPGRTAFLQKPFTVDELLGEVARLLGPPAEPGREGGGGDPDAG